MGSANEQSLFGNPLDKYSLIGMSEEIGKRAVEQVPLLGQVALMGQSTIFYAAPNCGKTLLTLSLLTDSISSGRIDSSKVYYINVDDTGLGLAQKLELAEEYGFAMLSEGYRDFTASKLTGIMAELIAGDQARGVVVVLDTLKKFVDLMDKGKSSTFNKTVRQFIVKGGTLIALAHTNKRPGRDGKPIYGGTSDMIDDFDCAYTLEPVAHQGGALDKVVEFANIKRRGDVVLHTAYSYSNEGKISYCELVASVRPVDAKKLGPLKQAEALRSDADLIGAAQKCIRENITSKMKLADAVAMQTGCSKRAAIQIIEKYASNDPGPRLWGHKIGERGVHEYYLTGSIPPVASLDIETV